MASLFKSIVWFVILVGCHPHSEITKPEPAQTEPGGAAAAKSECVVPTTDALARFAGLTEADLSLGHDIDFNDDGQSDTIVRVQSGREPTHLLYLRKRGCIRFLAKVEAFRVGCYDTQSNGYCLLWAETWLMHGDRQRSKMSFIDGAYQPTGEVEFIPGPRDRPQ